MSRVLGLLKRYGMLASISAALVLGAFACGTSGASMGAGTPIPESEIPEDGVRLVVLLTVDQLRGDLPGEYRDLFRHGFRRLMDEGLWFVHGTHDHGETATAPGHTSLATGTYPSTHGVVANSWSERVGEDWVSVYAVADSSAPLVGVEGLPGRSPRPIQVPTVGEWLQEAKPSARVVAISRKDRAAITTAGHADAHVYWIAGEPSRFVTSSYYRGALPVWVEEFNRSEMPLFFRESWEDDAPPETLGRTLPDWQDGEGDWDNPAFPHRASDVEGVTTYDDWWIETTPFPDDAVLGLTQRAVSALELGQRDITDFLSVSFSQTDAIGHQFGPRSREQLVNLLHLDRLLGAFFASLDTEVGVGKWVLAMSSDHGVMDLPEDLEQREGGARRFTPEMRSEQLDFWAAMSQAAEEGRGVAPDETPWWVADVRTTEEVLAAAPTDTMAALQSRSIYPGRVLPRGARLGFQVRYLEKHMPTGTQRGSTHLSPYYYDRHVPIVFMGPGVPPGMSQVRAATIDVAPTLASLSDIPIPASVQGRILVR